MRDLVGDMLIEIGNFRSYVQTPGIQMLADWLLGILYLLALSYLALGMHLAMDRLIE